MADTFFGFNTTLPDDDGGDALTELSEEEYDALNDETFGAAREDDWEGLHENLVRLEKGPAPPTNGASAKDDDSDLDFNFARFNLDEFDISMDDTDSKVQLDPSVWATSSLLDQLAKPRQPHKFSDMLRQFPPQRRPQQLSEQQQQSNAGGINILQALMKQAVQQPQPIKMCTVEELERNMMSQNHKKEQVQSPEKMPPMNIGPPPGLGPMFSKQMQPPPHLMNQRGYPMPPGGGPGFNGVPFNPMMQRPPRSMPFSPMPGPPGLPMAGFPPMPGPIFRGLPPGHPLMNRPPFPPPQNSVNFNQRLVEEIQQNHPMLSFNRPPFFPNNQPPPPSQPNNYANGMMARMHRPQPPPNGNLKQEPQDPYANLMSNRDKQWLISIQLIQLHTDTPFYDDYYFTVYKERKAKGESRAYTSNTLNHPFTQGPKGHAHNMLLVSLSNKNGLNNGKNQFNRERRNSETQNKNGNTEQKTQDQPRHYTPLQFENSLGKLQVGCGSVTAPRKIIDMEVVSNDSVSGTSIEINTQRKTRQTLLHIETLFKVVLKLEDLENPMAIAAAQIIKQKREKEIQQAIDQAAIARALAGEPAPEVEEKISVPTDKYPEPEAYEELLPKLVTGLTIDKVTAMMIVRKGRNLVRRSLPFLKKNPHRWAVWCGIISSLYMVFKKEKEIDGTMMGIYEEFEKQLNYAKLEEVVQIAQSLIAEKKTNALLANKYTLSIIVALILHAETLFCNADYKRTARDEEAWQQFLKSLANTADGIKANGQPATGPMDSQVLKSMIQHLTRFNSVQTKPLLNLLTQADSK